MIKRSNLSGHVEPFQHQTTEPFNLPILWKNRYTIYLLQCTDAIVRMTGREFRLKNLQQQPPKIGNIPLP